MPETESNSQTNAGALQAVLAGVGARLEADDHAGARDLLLTIAPQVRAHPFLSNSLGYLQLQTGCCRDAVEWFEAALSLKPDYGNAASGLGMALQESGALSAAVSAYEKATLLAPQEPENWYNRACVLALLGRLDEAFDNLDQALALNRHYIRAHAKKAELFERRGNLEAAIVAAGRAADLAPEDIGGWRVLAGLYFKQGHSQRAIECFRVALSLDPDDFESLVTCGDVLRLAGAWDEADASLAAAARIDPDHNEVLMLAANLALARGDREAALQGFARVAEKGAYCTYPAERQPSLFRATLLFTPMAGNTPFEDLLSDRSFDADVMLILPGFKDRPEIPAKAGDVIINLVADADLGQDTLDATEAFVKAAQKPVINPPERIRGTDRQSIAERLCGLTDMIMPVTERVEAAMLLAEARAGRLVYPFILRQAGTHGGEAMERVDDAAGLYAFLKETGSEQLYRTAYVDYRSPDQLFRKYRFLFVGEAILPYHLAIGEHWKVHHQSTRMAEFEWMRAEEADFLDRAEAVFGQRRMAALEMIRRTIDLDYFGIDCALAPDGQVLVFEVNATMLIHFHNQGFEYKTPHVARIRDAFHRLVEARALKH